MTTAELWTLILILLAAKLAIQIWLEAANRRHTRDHEGVIPDAFMETLDEKTYQKSIDYTLAKSVHHQRESVYDVITLLIFIGTGILPILYANTIELLGNSAWSMAAYLFLVGVLMALPALPWDWHDQFHLEEQFGFNQSTPALWWMDRLKGLALITAIGYPLLVLVLKIVDWTGDIWWLVAWAVVLGFQLVMMVLAPIIILPLFNKFEPLPEGSLRDRLLALGRKTGFHAQSIQVMDGSRRSAHSNAFFTGFGKFRKIVLFDTLIEQLQEKELEAVLAHEIGHYKKRHIPKMLVWSAVASLAGFYLIAVLAKAEWFYAAFGFPPGNITPALLMFSLLSGLVTFWFSPLSNVWSRKYEFQADRYARDILGEESSLIHALRKLSEKNLSNLTPHPAYSFFYYSHPTLVERESALQSD